MNEGASREKLRLLIVDDSAVVRGLLSKRLAEEPDFTIAATATDGVMALSELKRQPVDIVILDLEMPRMDGFTALPEIRRLAPSARVIISSSLTERNADLSIRALNLGASECVAKPSSRQDRDMLDAYYRELIDKARALGLRRGFIEPHRISPSVPASHPIAYVSSVQAVSPPVFADAQAEIAAGRPSVPSKLLPIQRPKALAIASSTGGPQALMQIFAALKDQTLPVPVFITQHMPPTFTTILAKHLHQASGMECHEATQGMKAVPGHVYIAPGDYHMRPRREGDAIVLHLDQEPPVNYCRPAADPMIDALADLYGNRLMLLVLTGMGQDGAGGAKRLNSMGGTVVAQDKATSTVWGMPKAVAEQGSCRGLLPLSQFAGYLSAAFGTGHS